MRNHSCLEITCFVVVACVALIGIEAKVIYNFVFLRYAAFQAKVIEKGFCENSNARDFNLTPECTCTVQCCYNFKSSYIKPPKTIDIEQKQCLHFELEHTYTVQKTIFEVYDDLQIKNCGVEFKQPISFNRTLTILNCEPVQHELMLKSRKLRAFLILSTSIPCLLATVAVYLVVHELRNLHGKALLCHMISQIIVYLVIALTRLVVFNIQEHYMLCSGLGVIFQYFYIACFTWLSVTSYDIWRIFKFKVAPERVHRSQFKKNSLYAWGVPLSIVIASGIMNYSEISHKFKPNFAFIGCRRQANRFSLYVNLPAGFYLCLNLMIFIATAYRLLTHYNPCSATNDSNKISFKIYLRLFLVMGLSWLVGILVAGGNDQLLLASDILNISQGPAFFLIFVCKKPVFQTLYQRIKI